MAKKGFLPPDFTLDDVQLRIRESYSNPNVGDIVQAVLKDGPRTFKIATVFEIRDPKTDTFHHYSLRIDHIDRRKRGWFAKPEKSVRLEGDDPDEIEHLYRFLTSLDQGKLSGQTGEVHLIGSDDYENLATVIESLGGLAQHDKLEFVKALLGQLTAPGPTLEEFVQTFKSSRPDVLSTIAVAARLVQYEAACERFDNLLDDPETKELHLQTHLQQNPWIFGSEYSQLLDRQAWTRDDRLDFMLRRTVDGILEIVEIKTPGLTLLRYDKSHDSYHPSAHLAEVIGQVMRYIDEIERNRDSIRAVDGLETLKIRARIIIGRDGNPDETLALRNLNAHLTRIEILTFDQLVRIARRVLSVFQNEERTVEEETDGLPF